MSQGDPTFNASLHIRTLVNELQYADGDQTATIIRAIDTIRRRATMTEELRPWDAPTSEVMEDLLATADRYARNPEAFVSGVGKMGPYSVTPPGGEIAMRKGGIL